MTELLFDIEADGLYPEVTKIHCLVIKEVGGKTTRYNEQPDTSKSNLYKGFIRLQQATKEGIKIIAHNGIGYDIPTIRKFHPEFQPDMSNVVDTLVMSRFIFPDMGDSDSILMKKWVLPSKLYKSHSLGAWGYRLGNPKDDYEGGWVEWNQEMEDYCEQDVHTLESLYLHLQKTPYSQQAFNLEHRVAQIVARQQRHGFLFDKDKAVALYGKLCERRAELEVELRSVFLPRLLRSGKPKVPARDNKTRGYLKGAAYQALKLTEFNPSSRAHVGIWFKQMFNWKPTEFTDNGQPKVDETVLEQLPYPEAKLLAEYFMVSKRIGQVAEGDQAWFKHVKQDGRIHGSVITNGAVTGRMTHAQPNMAQVPASYSPYGHSCRELFTVPPSKILVGADASALELRCLAGYMAKWDGGDYIKTVVEGKKEDGTEIHTVNRKALEIDSRDDAKTWFYAFIYGAGDFKLGTVLIKPEEVKNYYLKNQKAIDKLRNQRNSRNQPTTKKEAAYIHRGSVSRAKFLKNLPALGNLTEAVKAKVKAQKYLVGLDKRKLHVRSSHSALNTLLQSAGAILMKQALVILDEHLQETCGYRPVIDYGFVANVHDEWQIEVREGLEDVIGEACVWSMEQAGNILNFKCPITGEYKTGSTWADTH